MSRLNDYQMADLPSEPPPELSPAPLPEDRGRRSRDLTLEAGLPANVDAEKTILGAILLDNQALSEAAETLEPDDFSLDSHRRIFQRMLDLADAQQAIDIVTLANELNRYKEVEAIGGVAYLASLTEGLPRRPVIEEYIRIVRDKAMARRLMAVCSAAIARSADQSEPALNVIEAVEGQLIEIAQSAVAGKLRTVAESVEAAGGVDRYMAPILDPVEMTGLETGFSDFDAMIGGLRKEELIVIAARPSMGKTGLAAGILRNICIGTDKVAAFFSIEMSRESIERRLIACIGEVDATKVITGRFLTDHDRYALKVALSKVVESNLHIDDTPSITPTQMRAKARRLKQRKGRLDVVVIDYLQLMQTAQKFSNRQEEVSYISRSLKAMAKELECPVIALAQLSRASEKREDKRPMLSDLRESGQIEQDADIVTFLHRESYYSRDEEMSESERAMAELITAKNRNGPVGTTRLVFIAKHIRFENVSWRDPYAGTQSTG